MQYVLTKILFHSVPYIETSPDTLEWEEYNKLGESASLGCVRLSVEDAKWIYDNCKPGTKVVVYSDSEEAGELGKPTSIKIAEDSPCKEWDPTDIDANNPWLAKENEYVPFLGTIDEFNYTDYANRYPDLKTAFGYDKIALYDHYITYGINEKRIAKSLKFSLIFLHKPEKYRTSNNKTLLPPKESDDRVPALRNLPDVNAYAHLSPILLLFLQTTPGP